jgi:hypothetical protein
LKAYAKKNQVNDAKWNLVTGDKKRDIPEPENPTWL